MNFDQVETYFKTRLKEVEPKFKEHEDAFATDNIGASKYDHAYHIAFGSMRCSPLSNQTTTDILTLEISLFIKGYRDSRTKILAAYEIANSFRLNAMRPEFAMNGAVLKNVVCTQMKPEPARTNDSAIKVTCSFDVTLNFSTNN